MKRKEAFWGLLFILAAVLIILNQFGSFAGISMFDIIATVILGGIIIRSVIDVNFWGILFPAAFIGIIFADELNITRFTPWPALFTAFLLSLGLSILFRRPYCFIYDHDHGHWHNNCDHSFSSSVINEQDDNAVECSVSFGESIKYVNSANFERADIKCSFGDVKVYFDNAQIPSGKADIYLDVSFGDAQLFIPKTWRVVNEVHVFLGDMGEKNRSISTGSPVVTLHGNINFGDTSIFYV
jgi:predicted membrane protein